MNLRASHTDLAPIELAAPAYPDLLNFGAPSFLSQTGGYTRYLVTKNDLLVAARIEREDGDFEPLTQYLKDPVRFAKEVLGVRLWRKQRDILRAMVRHNRITVAACYGSGKTFLAAVAVLWWMTTRRPCLVVTTAPTQRQVRDLLWREINSLHTNALQKLPGKVFCDRWIISHDRMAKGYTGKGENNVAGLHAPANVLFIEDEAAGIEKRTEEGFAGITIGPGNCRLKIGNPICENGPFFDSHMHPTIKLEWERFTIDALETPNVRGIFRKVGDQLELVIRQKDVLFPGLVDPEWVRQHKIKWFDRGIISNWEQRCRGRFFVSSAEKVIPLEWLLLAEARWEHAPTIGTKALGVDIAGGGQDSTTVAFRAGRRLRIIDEWQEQDHDEQALRIAQHAKNLDVDAIFVDATGIGKAVWIALRKLQDAGGLPSRILIQDVILSSSPEDGSTFQTRADELQFEARWAFNPKNPEAIAINPACPYTPELRLELAMRGWWKNDRHKICTEGKAALKRRGEHKSPDKGDAAALACLPVPAAVSLL